MPCIIMQAGPEKGKGKKCNQPACVSNYGTFLFRDTIKSVFSIGSEIIKIEQKVQSISFPIHRCYTKDTCL